MRYPKIIERLGQGETVTVRSHGNSMTPRIKSGQKITVEPLHQPPRKGDVVLAKVRGHYYFHLVTGVRGTEYQISNNHGHVNGWTSQVYGLVTKVET